MEPFERYRWLCHYLRRQAEGDRFDQENNEIKSIYRDVKKTHHKIINNVHYSNYQPDRETEVRRQYRRIHKKVNKFAKQSKCSNIYFGVDSENKILYAESNMVGVARAIEDDYNHRTNFQDGQAVIVEFKFDHEEMMKMKRGGVSVIIRVYRFIKSKGSTRKTLVRRDDTCSSVRIFYNQNELFDFDFKKIPEIIEAVRAKLFQNTLIGHLQYTEVIERVREWQKSKKT